MKRILVVVLAIAACGDGTGPGNQSDILVPDIVRLDAIGDTATAQLRRPLDGVTWHIGNEQVATVSNAGLITARFPGWTWLKVTAGTALDSAFIDVRQIPTRVDITPVNDTLLMGGTAALTVRAFDANNHPINSGQVTWHSTDSTKVRPVWFGAVTGIAPGIANVIAVVRGSTADSAVAQATLVVAPAYSPAEFTQFSMGRRHVCAITPTSDTYCWGSAGMSGTSAAPETCRILDARLTGSPSLPTNASCFTTPQRVEAPVGFSTISAGEAYTCGVAVDGVVYCWGFGGPHLGIGPLSPPVVQTPRAVQSDVRFTQVSTWSRHTCAVSVNNQIYCWGIESSAPTRVNTSTTFVSVSVGDSHRCALDSNGTAYCWGANAAGQLGTGGPATVALSPQPVSGTLQFATLTTGHDYTCGITAVGSAYCWGSIVRSNVPVPFRPTETWTSLRAGFNGLCGTRTNSTSWCEEVPTRAVERSGFTNVQGTNELIWSGLEPMFCGFRAGSNELFCWGISRYGQAGSGTFFSRVDPTAVFGGY